MANRNVKPFISRAGGARGDTLIVDSGNLAMLTRQMISELSDLFSAARRAASWGAAQRRSYGAEQRET